MPEKTHDKSVKVTIPSPPLAVKFRVTMDSTRRTTRKTALPLPFKRDYLQDLLKVSCIEETLDGWVRSDPVVRILKRWVAASLESNEHEKELAELFLPEETEEKWEDYGEECTLLARHRLKHEAYGMTTGAAESWSATIEQLVRESWADVERGPLNHLELPGKYREWSCTQAFKLLRTIYENLRGDPKTGYFAALLGEFTGKTHMPQKKVVRNETSSPTEIEHPKPKGKRGRPPGVKGAPKNQSHNPSGGPHIVEISPGSEDTPGCLRCRRKHRPCDRSKPQCGECRRTGTVCHWLEVGTEPPAPDKTLLHALTASNRSAKDAQPDSVRTKNTERAIDTQDSLNESSPQERELLRRATSNRRGRPIAIDSSDELEEEEEALVPPTRKPPKRLRLTLSSRANATGTGAPPPASTNMRNERTERAMDTLKTSKNLLSDIMACVNSGAALRNEAQLGAQLISQFLESTIRGRVVEGDRLVDTLRTCKSLFADIEKAAAAADTVDPGVVAKLGLELVQHTFKCV